MAHKSNDTSLIVISILYLHHLTSTVKPNTFAKVCLLIPIITLRSLFTFILYPGCLFQTSNELFIAISITVFGLFGWCLFDNSRRQIKDLVKICYFPFELLPAVNEATSHVIRSVSKSKEFAQKWDQWKIVFFYSVP